MGTGDGAPDRVDFMIGYRGGHASHGDDRANSRSGHNVQPPVLKVGNKKVSRKKGMRDLLLSVLPGMQFLIRWEKCFEALCGQELIYLLLVLVARMHGTPLAFRKRCSVRCVVVLAGHSFAI